MNVLVAACIVAGFLIAKTSWIWVTGDRWLRPNRCPQRHRYTHRPDRCRRCSRRRYVTRPVRATGNNLLTATVLGTGLAVWRAPEPTFWVAVTVTVTLAAGALIYQLRQRLDRRVKVVVGDVIPNPRPRTAPPVSPRELEPATR